MPGAISAGAIVAAAAGRGAAPAQQLVPFGFLELPDALKEKIAESYLHDAPEYDFLSMLRLSETCRSLHLTVTAVKKVQIWWDGPYLGWHFATVVGRSRTEGEHQLRYDYGTARKRGISVDLKAYEAAGKLRWGDLVKGQSIVAQWRGTKQWWEGKVLALQDNGTVRVRYDDDGDVENVTRALIRPNAPAPR